MEELFQQVWAENGLEGVLVLLIFLVVAGPGYMYAQMRQSRQKTETTAQRLIQGLLVEEHRHADELEGELINTTHKLVEAKDEVIRLKLELVESQHKMEGMPEVSREMKDITQRMDQLELLIVQQYEQLSKLVRTGETRGIASRLQSLIEKGEEQAAPTQH